MVFLNARVNSLPTLDNLNRLGPCVNDGCVYAAITGLAHVLSNLAPYFVQSRFANLAFFQSVGNQFGRIRRSLFSQVSRFFVDYSTSTFVSIHSFLSLLKSSLLMICIRLFLPLQWFNMVVLPHLCFLYLQKI